MIDVKIVNKSTNLLPKYATSGSAGMDLQANLVWGESIVKYSCIEDEDNEGSQVNRCDDCLIMKDRCVYLHPNERALIPTGLFIELPEGYEAQVRPRSGIALKNGVTVANCIGTIDSDYRGEIKIILINLSEEPFIIRHSDRIAQMVFAKYEVANFVQTEALEATDRGEAGFGSTGVSVQTTHQS